jgi:DNA repair protein RadC
MSKHTQDEIVKMAKLVKTELVSLLLDLGQEKERAKVIAESIIREGMDSLQATLDMPYGGTLPPDELAEMMLTQYVIRRQGHFSEEAAAAVITV